LRRQLVEILIAGTAQKPRRRQDAMLGMGDAHKRLGADHHPLLQVHLRLVEETDPIAGDRLLERQVGGRNKLGVELLLLDDPTNRREIDRFLQNRKHRQRSIISDLAEAFEKHGFASTKELYAPAEFAFLQGKKRPGAIVRVGSV